MQRARSLPERWWIACGVFLLIAMVSIRCAMIPEERITRKGFDRLEIGMTLAEVQEILGRPAQYRSAVMGKVYDEQTFATNKSLPPNALQAQGYRTYDFHQWHSKHLSIMVVADAKGQVVCLYSGPGQSISMLAAFVGFVRKTTGW